MTYDRRSIRLKEYDYTTAGYYYITICTHDHRCLFGNISNGKSSLNKFGQVVEAEWLRTSNIRKNAELDQYMVMPNHLHGIIILDGFGRGTEHRAPTIEEFGRPKSSSIPTIIRSFKATVTKQIDILRGTPAQPVWQRNYYEHIIRNEEELYQISQYIINNPLKWQLDKEHPINWEIAKWLVRQFSTTKS